MTYCLHHTPFPRAYYTHSLVGHISRWDPDDTFRTHPIPGPPGAARDTNLVPACPCQSAAAHPSARPLPSPGAAFGAARRRVVQLRRARDALARVARVLCLLACLSSFGLGTSSPADWMWELCLCCAAGDARRRRCPRRGGRWERRSGLRCARVVRWGASVGIGRRRRDCGFVLASSLVVFSELLS